MASNEVYFLFVVGFIISLLKSFKLQAHHFNFFSSNWLNSLFSFLSSPQVSLIWGYLGMLVFVLFFRWIGRLFRVRAEYKILLRGFMSMSGAGIVAQIVFLPLTMLLPDKITKPLSWLAILWLAPVTIIAIRYFFRTSVAKALAIYCITVLVLFTFWGPAAVCPVFYWLGV